MHSWLDRMFTLLHCRMVGHWWLSWLAAERSITWRRCHSCGRLQWRYMNSFEWNESKETP